MATLTDLPPHVWALVLRKAIPRDLCRVAHVCRSLHALVTSRSRCACHRLDGLLGTAPSIEPAQTRAFWAHLRDVSEPPSSIAWDAVLRRGIKAQIALALRQGVDPSAHDQLALRWASRHGHTAMVVWLLRDARVDPRAREQEALRDACEYGHHDVVERLLDDERADPSAWNQCAVRWASRNGHASVVQRLLRDPRVDPSVYHQGALIWACLFRHCDVVRVLLGDARVANDTAALAEAMVEARMRADAATVALLQRRIDALREQTERALSSVRLERATR